MAPHTSRGLRGLTRLPVSPFVGLCRALPQTKAVAIADAARFAQQDKPSVFIAAVERRLEHLLPPAPAPGPHP